jgi:mannosyl-3-phosphoglycerate synthase
MLEESLNVINNSKICNTEITTDIKNHLLMLQQKESLDTNTKSNNQLVLMDPIKTIEIDKFHDLVVDSPRLLQQFNMHEK